MMLENDTKLQGQQARLGRNGPWTSTSRPPGNSGMLIPCTMRGESPAPLKATKGAAGAIDLGRRLPM